MPQIRVPALSNLFATQNGCLCSFPRRPPLCARSVGGFLRLRLCVCLGARGLISRADEVLRFRIFVFRIAVVDVVRGECGIVVGRSGVSGDKIRKKGLVDEAKEGRSVRIIVGV